MRLPEMGSSSTTQPTTAPPAHHTNSSGAKTFETAMYAAKGANGLNSYHNAVSFDQGAKDLLNDIKTAAKMQAWNMQVHQIQAEPPGTGSNGVRYDGETYVVTLTHASESEPGA
jgi:hypothetical protein